MASKTIKKLSARRFKTKIDVSNVVESEKTDSRNMAVSVVVEDGNSLSPHERDGDHTFTADERQFISLWVEFKNIVIVASMMGITQKEASTFLASEHVRNEIARISNARMYKRFDTRQMTLDNIESYLTSCITGENVAISEQLTEKEKLVAVKLLLDVKQIKADSMAVPSMLDNMPVMEVLEDASMKTIKALLSTCTKNEKQLGESIDLRQKVAGQIPYVVPEEEQDIMSMSPDELRELIDIAEKAKKDSQTKDKV